MKAPDLGAVFGPPPKGGDDIGAAPMDENMEPPEDDGAEMDEALDSAIDDIFASKDPAERREAFKTAIRLCKESEY